MNTAGSRISGPAVNTFLHVKHISRLDISYKKKHLTKLIIQLNPFQTTVRHYS